jgi:hypothetical protein
LAYLYLCHDSCQQYLAALLLQKRVCETRADNAAGYLSFRRFAGFSVIKKAAFIQSSFVFTTMIMGSLQLRKAALFRTAF